MPADAQRDRLGNCDTAGMDRGSLFDAYRDHVNAGKIEMFEKYGLDAVMGRRDGIRFWDNFDPDRSWINCHSNGGVFNLGHRHPLVMEAVVRALDTADIGNHHLPAPSRAALASRLAATTSNHMPGVVFGVAGGEAVDLAVKLARGATGRTGVVSAMGGYHGHTGLALATGDPTYRDLFGPNLPGFTQVPFNDTSAMEAAVGADTAAVILEPIPATLGMPIPAAEYLPAIQGICRDRGTLLIVDEVQTGLGRTGQIWAYEHWGLEPDMLVTGKALSGGVYPITATLMTREIHSVFDENPFVHISTFGGAEPGCAAAITVLDVIETPGFLDHVTALGDRFAAGFSGLPFEVRQVGLMMGLAFPAADAGLLAAKLLFDAGIFAVYANNDTAVLQFLPPLITTKDEVDEIIGIVRSVFG
jgi:acetylornithine/succinyldiaminopimelate/putrescine aminotransferase